MMEHIRPLERALSLVIAPIDSFTGRPVAARDVHVTIDGPFPKPLVKPDGYYVFYNLPGGEYIVRVKSDRYFSETLTANTGEEPVMVCLIPNRRYPVPKGTTWVEGIFRPNSTVHITPQGPPGIKLTRHTGDTITVLPRVPLELLTHKWILIGKERRIIAGQINEYTYKLDTPLAGVHKKNAAVAPMSVGRTDSGGYLFCPISHLFPGQDEICLEWENGGTQYEKIIAGRGNTIKREDG